MRTLIIVALLGPCAEAKMVFAKDVVVVPKACLVTLWKELGDSDDDAQIHFEACVAGRRLKGYKCELVPGPVKTPLIVPKEAK